MLHPWITILAPLNFEVFASVFSLIEVSKFWSCVAHICCILIIYGRDIGVCISSDGCYYVSSEDDDEIVECDHCGVAVHEGCYGISDNQSVASTESSASTEPWYCDACKAGVKPVSWFFYLLWFRQLEVLKSIKNIVNWM